VPADATDFETLVARFEELGPRDRKAVLDQLDPEDRGRVEAALAAEAEARRVAAEQVRRAGRQFAGYSPWLSQIVQQSLEQPEPEEATITGAARRAVADAHRALLNEADETPSGFFDQLRGWAGVLIGTNPERPAS